LAEPIALQNYNTLLKKLLNTKGRDPLEDILGTLVPTIGLEVQRPEWEFLKGTRLCLGRVLTGALAANNSASGLRPNGTAAANPNPTQTVVIVKGFFINPGSAGTSLDVRYRTPQVATGVIATPTVFLTDLRLTSGGTGRSPSTFGLSVQAGAVTGTGPLLVIGSPSNTIVASAFDYVDFVHPIILDGNAELLVWASTQNLAVDITFVFYERTTELSEIPA
jgi:hypothetical protein